jgi:ABC-type multidrug transport system ATPase subunit
MGFSHANLGKTALLDALSGRMFYGEVTGTIQVNGHDTTLEKHSCAVAYVPKASVGDAILFFS